MKRRLFRLGLLVLAGAIVNVAVAWASAYFVDLHEWHMKDWQTVGPRWLDRDQGMEWFADVYRGPGGVFIFSSRWTSDNPLFGTLPINQMAAKNTPRIAGLHDDQRPIWRAVEARGWPTLSLWCEYAPEEVAKNVRDRPIERIDGGITVDGAIYPRHYYYIEVPLVLPYWPVFPGFAINTIFYAAILWLLFFAPGRLRRTIRRRRGLCPACAYPIGASPVCTECGATVGGVTPRKGDGM